MTDPEIVPDAAADRIAMIGQLSGQALTEACNTAADRIVAAAEAVTAAAESVMREASELAAMLRARGEQMAAHVDTFAAMTRSVAVTMEAVKQDVSKGNEGGN